LNHDFRGLFGVTAGAGPQGSIGAGQFQFLEKDIGHLGIVVLPGVNQMALKPLGIAAQLPQHRPYLHEIEKCSGVGHGLHSHLLCSHRIAS
jgi:hypothetical protein